MQIKEFQENRRKFITLAGCVLVQAAIFPGCKSGGFVRPARVYDLGQIRNYLFKKVFLREKQLLVVRKEGGWGCLSTKCSREGCDLTYQEKSFFCPCCSSHFSHLGEVLKGPANRDLPWLLMEAKGNSFKVDSSKIVSSSKTFTTEEIEKVIREYGFIFKNVDEIDQEAVKLPSVFYEDEE